MPNQNPFDFNQVRQYSAISFHPLSIVNEWPRFENSLYSATAFEFLYFLSVLFTITGGTVWSSEPEISSKGPRMAFPTLTLVAELGLNIAVAAWNIGRPGPGMAYIE